MPVLESLFNKVAGLKTCNFIRKRLRHRCFPVIFENCLRTPSFRTPPVATFEAKHILQLSFYYVVEYEISSGIRATRKKLNIFMLQLPIYYMLE